MFRLQNKVLSQKNGYKLFVKQLIFTYIILGCTSLIINGIIYKDFYISLLVSFSFLFAILFIDRFFLKESKRFYMNKMIDEHIDLMMIYSKLFYNNKLITSTFYKLNNSLWKEDIQEEEKIELIKKYYNSERFEIIYLAINNNMKYEKMIKVINSLKEDYFPFQEYKLSYGYLRFFFICIALIESFLFLVHPYFETFFKSSLGIVLHTILLILFLFTNIILSFIYSKYIKNDLNKYFNYYQSLCIIEKPFFAFDHFCLLSNDLGQRLNGLKEYILNHNFEIIINFILNNKEKILITYIVESLINNSYIKDIPIIEKESLNLKYIPYLFYLICLVLFVLIFLKESIYL